MDNPPIDVVALAARRYHEAGAALLATRAMQASASATALQARLTIETICAKNDLDAAINFATEISNG